MIEKGIDKEEQSSNDGKAGDLASELRSIADKQNGDQQSQNGRLDHDSALEVGYASKPERSQEAYYRQVGELAKEARSAGLELSKRHKAEESAFYDNTETESTNHREARQELYDRHNAERVAMERDYEERLQDLNSRYNESPHKARRFDELTFLALRDASLSRNLPDSTTTAGRVADAVERAEYQEERALKKYKEANNE